MTRTGLKLGSLGGPQTFGAQASKAMMQRFPEFAEIVYYPTADAAREAVVRGEVDALCAPEQMVNTGFHPGIQSWVAVPDSPLHIAAESTHVYHCTLLGKPGATLADVRKVIGHTGSVTQSRSWLEANLPNAEIEIIHTNSMYAGQSILESDGSIASVGTPELGRELGLTALAKDIDGGSVGNYWALCREPLFSDKPTRVVVAGRFADDGQLSRLIGALEQVGYLLQTISSATSGKALYQYDYVLRFRGEGKLEEVQSTLAPFKSARLAGAFESRE
jgi:prephenate dehydratase